MNPRTGECKLIQLNAAQQGPHAMICRFRPAEGTWQVSTRNCCGANRTQRRRTGRDVTVIRDKISFFSWSAAALALFAFVGWLFTASMVRYGEFIERRNLTALAASVAAAIESDLVAGLKGNGDDIGTPAFEELRAELKRIHEAIPNSRFVYLMTERAGKWVFLADAEDVGSPDYSPPGQLYDADTSVLHEVFNSGTAAFDGPQRDAWGEWMSGLAPILDARTRKPIAVVGVDVSTAHWMDTVTHYRQVAVVISGLVLALVALFLFCLYLQARHVAVMRREIASRRRAEDALGV